jgi:hypothetical protein
LQFLDAQRFPAQAKESGPHPLRLFEKPERPRWPSKRIEQSGLSATYLLVALASLYLSSLPILRGKLPGWDAIKVTPAATPSPSSQDGVGSSQAQAYGGRPMGNLPPGSVSHNPVFPRNFTPFPYATPFRPPGFTPPPRPFATPPTMHPFPTSPGNSVGPGSPTNPSNSIGPMRPESAPFSPPPVSGSPGASRPPATPTSSTPGVPKAIGRTTPAQR